MGRLVVVSNRVAEIDSRGEASKGGLAMALSAALREHHGLWFGWSGQASAAPGPANVRRNGGIDVATIDLTEDEIENYYNGFSNRTLWPLCHYRPDLVMHERAYGAAYAQVNEKFADALMPLLREDDTLWVHDYHLVPLARALRARGAQNRIGFFLHIPWPARQVLSTLPRHHQLVQAMFDYDLIGFQTQGWLDAFEDYVVEELKGSLDGAGSLTALDRTVRAGAYPIGLDMGEMRAMVASEAARRTCATMKAEDQQLLIGVDRIDYSKGLPQKFAAFEQFLEDEPQWREKVALLQIGQPSRTDVEAYQQLHDRLLSEAGRINGEFGTLAWAPLRYRAQSMPRDVLTGAYRAARAAIVTPLYDGMNLVAKEYVAAQDPDDPGVLILSRFAGAAAQMREALLVNPNSREDLADAIRRAVEMPRAERIARWKALYAGVARDDLTAWRQSFLHDLLGDRPVGGQDPLARAPAVAR
ncbi:alpha,alpha-trehalose-phosphate synthase (UDP-forming) [Sphingomonas aracearum]|uniref:Trehalose-6-phosphate synthase n=1 Tax=Sphingomonas aracearum TaxID=2283317 RepID=A0A369VT85_9SPHN|nr:trehalose-6-phosphate synthase [Sphingomonas aracearum]RDE04757.1 trehalose-6-phosphate synthase [Sphingomonas aracearum]